jgi:hypothetical protein
MSDSSEVAPIAATDHARNVGRALVRGLPYVGSALEQLLFGLADEIRWRRLEAVLTEFSDHLKRAGATAPTAEEFATLFERVAPSLAREPSPDRRERFRDLLLQAATIPTNAPAWSDVDLAATLLIETAAPGLAIIAAVARSKFSQPSLVALPAPQLVDELFFLWENPVLGGELVPYEWPVVEEWARRLKERRLLAYQSHDARGGFGRVSLTSLGNHLVRWSLSSSAGGSDA